MPKNFLCLLLVWAAASLAVLEADEGVLTSPAIVANPGPSKLVSSVTRVISETEEIEPFKFGSDWELGVERLEITSLGNVNAFSSRWQIAASHKINFLSTYGETSSSFNLFLLGVGHSWYWQIVKHAAFVFYSEALFVNRSFYNKETLSLYSTLSQSYLQGFSGSLLAKVEANVPYVPNLNIAIGAGLNCYITSPNVAVSFLGRELFGRISLYYYL